MGRHGSVSSAIPFAMRLKIPSATVEMPRFSISLLQLGWFLLWSVERAVDLMEIKYIYIYVSFESEILTYLIALWS